MSGNAAEDQRKLDPVEISRIIADISQSSQQLVKNFLAREQSAHRISMQEALSFGKMFQAFVSRAMTNPMSLAEAQLQFWQNYMSLVQNVAMRFMGQASDPVAEPARGDKRFRHEAWEQNPFFDYVKQTYLIGADYFQAAVSNVEGIDDRTRRKLEFFTGQFVDAMSPTNFLATNPAVIRETIDSRGQNLLMGLKNILEDLEENNGRFSIRMTDRDAFKIGENIVTTPGKVIYQNDMMQLIQYEPSTKDVYSQPLLIIPPWINKYYILDLSENNSFIRYAVAQGYTVFLISWVNPDERHQDAGFDYYMEQGPLAALDVVTEITGADQVNTIGYCLGGTLQACTLSYLASKGDKRINTATYFTSMIDFEQPGDLEVFIDEDQIKSLEEKMNRKGYLEGKTMATTFNMLRANDLIWSYYVNNYLLGREPLPFDILYWNSDSTNLPATMHSYYLRNMYQKNLLKEPGGITLKGTPIDIRNIKNPVCFISTVEDHIAPWKSTYSGATLHTGKTKFILGGSGHIAGIINPPAKKKYSYWTREGNLPATPEQWLEGAKETAGSWWPAWDKWLSAQSGEKVPARKVGANKKYKALENAPGSYVSAVVD